MDREYMPRFQVEEEYKTLRDELLQTRKNVFERPLVIAALSVVGLKFIKWDYISILPFAMVFVSLFNYWFTINRLRSAARISAYVQTVMENRSEFQWIGWETSLRLYRKWIKLTPDVQKVIDRDTDKDSLQDALHYYPPIYYFHIFMIIVAVVCSIGIAIIDTNYLNIFLAILIAFSAMLSIKYFCKYNPYNVAMLIERSRVVWRNALPKINESADEIKNTSSNKAN